MIIKFNLLRGNNIKFTQLTSVCNYFNCKPKDLYYIEGIKNFMFHSIKTIEKDDENNLEYCKNREGYPFVIWNNKFGECYLVDTRFMNDLKIINILLNRNNKE